jgi:hypothetical protein
VAARHRTHPVKHTASPTKRAVAPSTLTVQATATTQQAAPPATHPAAPKPTPTAKPTPTPAAAQGISAASGVTGLSCSDEGGTGSIPGGTAVSFSFVNNSQANVEIYYLAPNDSVEPFRTVSPGSSYDPGALTDQEWMVGGAGGGCLGIYTIDESGEVAVS